MAATVAVPARAQVAISVAAASNELFRGDSISDESPVLRSAVSLDLPAGFFAGASASLAPARENGVRITGSSQYAGWAVRQGQVSIETGIIHHDYAMIADTDYRRDYVEGFIGLTHKTMRLRVYVSPDYSTSGDATYYVDAGAKLFKLRDVTVNVHGGLSLIPSYDAPHRIESYADWSIEASRPVGAFSLGLTLAGTSYPVFSSGKGPRFAATLSRSF